MNSAFSRNWEYWMMVMAATPSSPAKCIMARLNRKVMMPDERLVTISEEPLMQVSLSSPFSMRGRTSHRELLAYEK